MPLTVPSPVLWTIADIYGVLGLATAIIVGLSWQHRDQDYTELKARIQSWWIIVTIFSGALLLNRTVSILFFALLSVLALREYVSLISARLISAHWCHRPVLVWAYLSIVLQYVWVYLGWYDIFLIFIPLGMFLLLSMQMVLIGKTDGFLNVVGTIYWGLMLTVYTLSHLPYLLMLPITINPGIGGLGLLVYLVLLTELNDITQYCCGKLWGRHQAVPQVSPGKTMEGLLGGVIITTATAVALAPWLTPFTPLHGTGLGLLLSLAGFMGDVTVSAVKRDLGVKDSGTLLPGHGGILDRMDSLIYTAPLFFYFTVYLYLGGQWL